MNRRFLTTCIFIAIFPTVVAVAFYHCHSQISGCKEQHNKEKNASTEKYLAALASATTDQKKTQKKTADNAETQAPNPCSGVCSLVTKTVEDPVGLFTLVLCFLVWLQFIWLTRQEDVLEASVNAASSAAEAAKQNALAYAAAERPYLFIIFQLGHATRDVLKTKPPKAVFLMSNGGRTPARIIEYRAETHFGNKLPTKPKYTDSKPIAYGSVFAADARTDFQTFEYKRLLTPSEIDDLYSGEKGFFFFGYVQYSDIFRLKHTRHFGFRCKTSNGDFESCGGKSYNFTVSEEEG